ncbi:MAG TPA: nucleotidyltransferase family protein [Leadbetterella sp.]|nr:nucleotidyltransferase family protein [Leadbetterella sp.]
MENTQQNIIPDTYTVRQALAVLDKIGIVGNVLFVINDAGQLTGTITDGDIRRGLLKNLDVNSPAIQTANKDFYFAYDKIDNIETIKKFKLQGVRFVPLLNQNKELIKVINTDNYKGFLPIDVFIMAGGKGARLMPLTKDCPKPMLKVGNKPIIEHNIDRLTAFGVNNYTISVNYLGHVIRDYFETGEKKEISISYVEEKEPLGTLGSISLVPDFSSEYILVMNSDLLTDIDYSDFFEDFISTGADISIASIPYYVDIPYAVLETDKDNKVKSLKEKPKYTYYSNAGIYLIKKSVLVQVPFNQFYNATDLIEDVIKNEGKVTSYPILSYWLDIGKMPDYLKAQEDIKHLRI